MSAMFLAPLLVAGGYVPLLASLKLACQLCRLRQDGGRIAHAALYATGIVWAYMLLIVGGFWGSWQFLSDPLPLVMFIVPGIFLGCVLGLVIELRGDAPLGRMLGSGLLAGLLLTLLCIASVFIFAFV